MAFYNKNTRVFSSFRAESRRYRNAKNVPTSAKEIAETFKHISSSPIKVIEEQWTDESLKEVQTAFGREETNAQFFMVLIKHIIHHRGQVMGQAGIKPFGVYGPPKEDWIRLGVENQPL